MNNHASNSICINVLRDEKVERNYCVTGVYAVKVVSIITVIDFREKRPQLLISKFAL